MIIEDNHAARGCLDGALMIDFQFKTSLWAAGLPVLSGITRRVTRYRNQLKGALYCQCYYTLTKHP